MNFVFISPGFPLNYYQFLRGLKNNGVRVLGIGDEPYAQMSESCRSYLDEYYQVSSLENYDEVYRAFAYLSYKYGKIDFVESNNEYWLMQDARLRQDFNINSGVKMDDIGFIRYKSQMKEKYHAAGIKTPRYHLTSTYEAGLDFIKEVGYPVIVKPDDGVGASFTHRIDNDEELKDFYDHYPERQMIMEEFVNGDLVSYDGICDAERNVIYETSHNFPRQVMNIVNEELDCYYWSIIDIPENLRSAGTAALKAFPSNSRFFHMEFFFLKEDKEGLGKKGDVIGLEVNMRPPGGPTLDMMDYAADIDVYQLWANMICFNEARMEVTRQYYVVYASRRFGHNYSRNLDDVRKEYADKLVMDMVNPPIIADAMGDEVLVARFKDEGEIMPFVKAVVG